MPSPANQVRVPLTPVKSLTQYIFRKADGGIRIRIENVRCRPLADAGAIEARHAAFLELLVALVGGLILEDLAGQLVGRPPQLVTRDNMIE